MKPKINAIYVSVKDMKRAVKFYEEVFGRKVSSFNKRMSSFDFDNISFLLFDPKTEGEKIIIGNNIVPDIEVDDVNKTLEVLKNKKCEIVMPINKINNFLIFQVKDSEGNIIEFYQTEK